MAQLLIRGLDESTVAGLKERAKRNRRSLQAEAKLILEESVDRSAAIDRMIRIADEMRERTKGRQHTDSVEIIREMRYGSDSE